ncbi:barrier-to-autointegration factor-like, partial [Neopelma chrysocephalum]|uniref:barrier-to-autointegration factor-like n=1 Tax=Neopelma chrysocephalum TaxID=114329 RepID=UPI000FCD3143
KEPLGDTGGGVSDPWGCPLSPGDPPGDTPVPSQAYVVLGQFLVLRKDEELFREWLKETCGANAKQSRDCSGCLREWCDAFL